MSFYVCSHAVTRQMPKGALKVTPKGTSEWLVAESDVPARIHTPCAQDLATEGDGALGKGALPLPVTGAAGHTLKLSAGACWKVQWKWGIGTRRVTRRR
jgi:hypothetical protein